MTQSKPKWRWFGWVLMALALVLVPLAVLIGISFQAPPPGPMGESIPPDEDVVVSQIIDSGIAMLNATRHQVGDGTYRRDAHAKTHACLLGDFQVTPPAEPLNQGLFAEPKRYKAWVRFSSGSTAMQSDWTPDARGMGVKVLGVPGAKVMEGEQAAETQDFLMINNPIFFIRDVKNYALLTQFQGEGSQFGYFFQGRNPLAWKLREFRIGLGILKPLPTALLATQFHSMTAYKLGVGTDIKFTMRPVACTAGGSLPSSGVVWQRDSLRAGVAEHLRAGRACFEMAVQPQVAGANMPVEDTTVLWDPKVSPFVPVARIEIPPQDIRPALDSGFCENLSMTPWHTLPQHRPIGGLNRIRLAVYQGIARYRRCMNGKAYGEPLNDGSLKFSSLACVATGGVPELSKN